MGPAAPRCFDLAASTRKLGGPVVVLAPVKKRVTVDDLRAEAAESSPDNFRRLHPDPLLIGEGMVSIPLPDPSKPGTLAFNPGDGLNMESIRQSRALKGRVFWIRTESGGRLGETGRRVTLGRDRQCDIVLPDFPISGMHCWFVQAEDGSVEVVDDHSTNGTVLNGVDCPPREPRRLADGDDVVFGRFAFKYWSSAFNALNSMG